MLKKNLSKKALILLLIAFILEILNIPYINRSYLFIFHGTSTLSFSVALYLLSESRLKGFVWAAVAAIFCGQVGIFGLITVSLLFLTFRVFPKIYSKESLYVFLILLILIIIFFYDVLFLGKTLKCTNMTAYSMPGGVYGEENNYITGYFKITKEAIEELKKENIKTENLEELRLREFTREELISRLTSMGFREEEIQKISDITYFYNFPVIDLSAAVTNEVLPEFIKKGYARGYLPLWNPYQACGYPAAGIIAYPYFNPFDSILHLLPSKYSWDVYNLFRIFFAGFFMFLFIRELGWSFIPSLTSAIAYMFSSPVIIYITDIQISSSMLYPFFFFVLEKFYKCQERKYLILTSLVILFMIFSGFPEHVVLISLLGLVYFIFRTIMDKKKIYFSLKNISFAFIISICLGLIVIIPFAEFLFLYSWTDHHPDTGLRALEISGIFGMFIPRYTGQIDRLYTGVIPLLLLLLAFGCREKNKLLYFWGGTLLLLLGKLFGIPVINWIGYLPVIKMLSFTANSSQCMAFIIAILAGGGMENLYRKRLSLYVICMFIISLLIIITIPLYFNLGEFTLNQLILKYILLFCILLFYIPAVYCFKISQKNISIIFLIALSVELFSFIPKDRLNKLDSFPHVPFIKYLQEEQEKERYRVYGIKGCLSPNVASVYELDDLGIYMNLCDKRYAGFFREFINSNYFVKDFFPAVRYNIDYKNEFLDMLNLGYLILPSDTVLPENDRWIPVYCDEVNIYKNVKALPRVLIVNNAEFMENDEKILAFLREKKNKLREICCIYEKTGKNILKKGDEGRENSFPGAEISYYSNDEVIVKAFTEKEGFLILNDTYYPGWKVFVDGREEKLYRANYLFRGVLLKEGEHTVRFVFFPYSFYISKVISLCVMYLVFVFIIKEVKK